MSFKAYSAIITLIILSISLLLCASAKASSLQQVLSGADKLGLENHPVWLKLLHYDLNESSSAVLTDNFFLSSDGRYNPKAELTATINAYFSPWEGNVNNHAQCRFPARYLWLSNYLDLPANNVRKNKCQNLEKWALFDSVQSISLLLVSGYLGNPASTFGHVLLKFNTDSENDKSGLFDLTLNYGAMVPENENSILYVIRGLFGGYKAGFSDKYFYTQDLVYSRTEFRDIWDYRLVLSDYERSLLIFHIWEIIGKKFDYYFLDKNCAYRLGELLDVVIEEDLMTNVNLWYFPDELFYRLKDINQNRQMNPNGSKLIQSVRFIPSSQRELFHQLKLLSSDELKIFSAIISDGISSIPIHLTHISTDRKIIILDGLLAYQQYRLIAEAPNPDPTREKAKDQILLTRLQLPARSREYFEIPEVLSPAEGTRPMAFSVSFASESNGESFLRLAWSPFKKESVGKNSLEGDEFVLLDLAVGFFQEKDKIFLDKIDLARILNLNILSFPVGDESLLSWQFRAGIDRIKKIGKNRYDGVLSFGIGRAIKLKETLTGYAIVDFVGHSLSPVVRLRPHFGLIFNYGVLRSWMYGGVESIDYDIEFRDIWGGKLQYQLTDRNAFYTEISNENATLVSAGMIWYW